MNRRGVVLLATLLALLLAGALATAALAAARLRWLAGARTLTATHADLGLEQRLHLHIAALTPAGVDSIPIGASVALAPADTLIRLGPSLFQVRVDAGRVAEVIVIPPP